jgi:hypothetical protein
MPFYTDLRNALKTKESLNWIKKGNKREVEAKLNDLARPTMRWIPQVNGLSKTQLAVAEKATKVGWQVYGVMQRTFEKHVALILRSADEKTWGVLYPNSLEIERYATTRLVFPMRKTYWLAKDKPKPLHVSVKNKVIICGKTGPKTGPVKAPSFWDHIAH